MQVGEIKDFYAVLGLDRNASEQDIKRAYRKLARESHPDVNPDDAEAEERFKQINEAHEVLGDPEKRERYNATLVEIERIRRERDPIARMFQPFGSQAGPTVLNIPESWRLDEKKVKSWIGGVGIRTEGRREEVVAATHLPIVREVQLTKEHHDLAIALRKAREREGSTYVVISTFNRGAPEKSIEYPLWRVRNQDGKLNIEVSTAVSEGRYPFSHELSQSFTWQGIEQTGFITDEEKKLVKHIRLLADIMKVGRRKIKYISYIEESGYLMPDG